MNKKQYNVPFIELFIQIHRPRRKRSLFFFGELASSWDICRCWIRYTQSSLLALAKKRQDGTIVDIDSGVTPDVEVVESKLFDRKYLGSNMETWINR